MLDETLLNIIRDSSLRVMRGWDGDHAGGVFGPAWMDSINAPAGYHQWAQVALANFWERVEDIGDNAPAHFVAKKIQLLVSELKRSAEIKLQELRNMQALAGSAFEQQLDAMTADIPQLNDEQITRLIDINPTDIMESAFFGVGKAIPGSNVGAKLTNKTTVPAYTIEGIRALFYKVADLFQFMPRPNGRPYHRANIAGGKFVFMHSGKHVQVLEKAAGIGADASTEVNPIRGRIILETNSNMRKKGLEDKILIKPETLGASIPKPFVQIYRGVPTISNNVPQGGFTELIVQRTGNVTFTAEVEMEWGVQNPFAVVLAEPA